MKARKWAKRLRTLATFPRRANEVLRGAADGAEVVADVLHAASTAADACRDGLGRVRDVVDRVRREGVTVTTGGPKTR
jgi:hypothetical protein